MLRFFQNILFLSLFTLVACESAAPETVDSSEDSSKPFFQCNLGEDTWMTTEVSATYNESSNEMTIIGRLHKGQEIYKITLHIFQFENEKTYLFTENEENIAIATAEGEYMNTEQNVDFYAVGGKENGGRIRIFDFNKKTKTISGDFEFQMIPTEHPTPYIVMVSNGSFNKVMFDVVENTN